MKDSGTSLSQLGIRGSDVPRKAKRVLDQIGSAMGLVILSPLMILIGILIKLDSSGPILYRQKRLGCGGAPFDIFKYRTMYSPPGLSDLQEEEEVPYDPDWFRLQKIYDDPRITRVGRILRKTSLDELPQLWNVVRGEMSLVGPRPILPLQRSLYADYYSNYIQARPGMTGLWQVSGRNLLSFSERVDWDQQYLENWSFVLDLQILARTVSAVVRGVGAY